MTRADLPPPETRRWVASRKAAVVRAVEAGLIARRTALETYALSEEEFTAWEAAVRSYGEAALRATWLQRYASLRKISENRHAANTVLTISRLQLRKGP